MAMIHEVAVVDSGTGEGTGGDTATEGEVQGDVEGEAVEGSVEGKSLDGTDVAAVVSEQWRKLWLPSWGCC